MNPFPHQLYAVNETQAAIADGCRRTLVTSPTGGGKSLVASMFIEQWLAEGLRTIVYTNRKMLVDQLHRTLSARGLEPAIHAAGHEEDRTNPVQVASIQTVNSRVRRRQLQNLFPADRVIVDEAHLMGGDMAHDILTGHIGDGARVVGLTATPIDMGGTYDRLIVAGTNSELRGCGLLVPSHHFGPDEPDMKAIKRPQDNVDDMTERETRQLMGSMTADGPTRQLERLHGRVWKWFDKLNPERKPTILFASGVPESLWFAEQFTKMGVPAAHIDGQDVWVDGELHKTSTEIRQQVLDASRDGRIKVLCNRFVLREGVDAPWLAHGIFATVFGTLQTFLQSGGRLLRAHPSLDHVTIQDHGANWWRFGSLNADREWALDSSGRALAGMRADAMREKRLPEPCRCPFCAKILARIVPGTRCPACNGLFSSAKKSRPVATTEGELREMPGDIFQPRREVRTQDAADMWKRIYFGSLPPKNPEKLATWKPRTFKQAEAAFAWKNNWTWPSHDLPFMPIDPADWYRPVHEVPRERLR